MDPVIKYSLAKYLDKGEDAWTQQPAADATLNKAEGTCWSSPAADGVLYDDICLLYMVLCASSLLQNSTAVDVARAGSAEPIKIALFGVFDGHGGKAAATFASRALLPRLQTALHEKRSPIAPHEPGSDSSADQDGSFHDAASVSSLASSCPGSSHEDETQLNSAEGGMRPYLHNVDVAPSASQAAEVADLRSQAAAAGLAAQTLARCDLIDGVAAALPAALVTAFETTQTDFFTHSQVIATVLFDLKAGPSLEACKLMASSNGSQTFRSESCGA